MKISNHYDWMFLSMGNNYTSLISFAPLAILAVVAWRTMDQPAAATPPLVETTAVAMNQASEEPSPRTPPLIDSSLRASYVAVNLEEIYVKPAGPKGLELTAATQKLHGVKVRISGQMVRHLHDDPRMFLMHPTPLTLIMSEFGLADDLPPSALHVILPDRPGWAPVWTPRPLEVYGTLELGPRQELDGRISHFRLVADHVVDAETGTIPDLMKPIGLQPGRLTRATLASPPTGGATGIGSSTPATH